ncbi:MAG: hypothetical protein LBB67_03570, partial [Oscillospiraceae bacterium]|nr:hypothetical protein [Oscillospiraceae bacterium]
MVEYYIGVDGGGTKTNAIATRHDGTTVAVASAASIHFYAVGMKNARAALQDLLQKLQLQGVDLHNAKLFIGSAALFGEATPEQVTQLCDGLIEMPRVAMDSDLFVALETMCCESPCAVAICGT